MSSIAIGLDFAKIVFQVRSVDAEGAVVIKRRLRRGEVETYFQFGGHGGGAPPRTTGLAPWRRWATRSG